MSERKPAGWGLPLPVVPSTGNPCFEHACSACCHDTEMILTEDDVQRIEGFLAADAEAARRLTAGEIWWRTAGDGFMELCTKAAPPAMPGPGRPCVFLETEGRCGVHAVRPEGCRLYPATWDEGLRRAVLDDDCPHTEAFRIPRATGDAVRRLAQRLEAERTARRKTIPHA